MSGIASRRVDPRALLRSARADRGAEAPRSFGRVFAVGALALASLGAFGAVVVRANDDAGVLAFIKQQSRPAQAVRQIVAVQPAAEGQRSFFPVSWGRRAQRDEGPRLAAGIDRQAQQRQGRIVASYAPFMGLGAPARPPVDARPERRYLPSSAPAIAPAAERAASPALVKRGAAVAYCVRTCDGFFFPLGPSNGSDAADAAACNSLCPASETRVYSRRIGDEMEEARARRDGRRYSALPAAFSHRNAYNAACSCTGAGPGLATSFPASRDETLRPGDIVMTGKGMMVFNGGRTPYREANFTAIARSRSIDAGTRETLRRLEQASLPGRSGIAHKPLAARGAPAPVFASAGLGEDATAVFRQVGPQPTRLR